MAGPKTFTKVPLKCLKNATLKKWPLIWLTKNNFLNNFKVEENKTKKWRFSY